MSDAFEGLKPAVVWSSFKALTQVPRPSGHEEKVREYLLGWAKERGFAGRTDEVGNLLIVVPATPGREKVATVVLQGHLDMVGEKNNDVEFDFVNDPIRVVLDGDFLRADGTTLGADNGIGVAMAMAIAIDPEAAHGPLELFFTVEEETGLTGAQGLKPGFLSGLRLVNIDSEEEGAIFAGCAGGCDTDTAFALEFGELPGDFEAVSVQVKGLAGGHSGLTIHENRANALKLLAMWLEEVAQTHEMSLTLFKGGDKHNAIPRESEAVVAGPQGLRAAVEKVADSLKARLVQEYSGTDPRLELVIGKAGATDGLSAEDSKRFLDLLNSIPHGVDAMSKDIAGLVETSTNMARIDWEEERAVVLHSSRSSVASALERIKGRITAIARLAGAKAEHGNGYPGWQPNLESKLLAKAKESYREVTGQDAQITAIHAGLECGIIGEKYPGMEMVSFGPNMYDVHSPDERLSVSSTARFYEYLKAFIASLD
jgi:dipeptidase D